MKKEIVAILICILLIVSSLVIVYPIKALLFMLVEVDLITILK